MPIARPSYRSLEGLSSPLRSEEHTSELQSPCNLVCRLLLEKKKKKQQYVAPSLVIPMGVKIVNIVAQSRRSERSPKRITFDKHSSLSFFFNDTATTEIYTLSLHDALPI